MFIYYNPNPCEIRTGDCTVRAISKALNQDWHTTYWGIAVQGDILCSMPSNNDVWGEYLVTKGFTEYLLPQNRHYTVEDFCRDNPKGIYILSLGTHVVCAENGDFYDIWDSAGEQIKSYWKREEN